MNLRTQLSNGSRRHGVVLLAVLVVVALLMLVGYQFFNLMSAEYEATYAAARHDRARQIAQSGLDYLAFVLSYPQNAGLTDGSDSLLVSPCAIEDNAQAFHGIPVNATNPRLQGYFSVVAPRNPDDPLAMTQGFRFGVEDESGKININTLMRLARGQSSGTGGGQGGGNGQGAKQTARDMLMKLPNMDQEKADSLINWTRPPSDSDSNASDAMYYSSLGYAPKYGPLESLEEMLLVKGFTPRLLFGNDLNRNGTLEPDEDDNAGVIDPGLARYLTVNSRELNLDSTGQQRININDPDIQTLYDKLQQAVGEELAAYIIAYRVYGPVATRVTIRIIQQAGLSSDSNTGTLALALSDSQLVVDSLSGSLDAVIAQQPGETTVKQGGAITKSDIDFEQQARQQITSLYALIGSRVQFTKKGDRDPTQFACPMKRNDVQSLQTNLPLLLDKFSSSTQLELTPRININTAPLAVLRALPNISEEDAQHIADHQPGPDIDPSQGVTYRTPAWLITLAGFQPDVVQQLEPYITTRSQVFRVQVLGYYEVGGPMARLEAVIDTNNGRPRIVYWRDITDLGRGFDVRNLGGTSR